MCLCVGKRLRLMTPRPIPLAPKLDTIPDELKSLIVWVLWRYEWQNEKWTKIPYQATANQHMASSNDPKTWTSFDKVVARCCSGGFDGIGFVLDPKNGIVGIDLDHCLDERTA